MKMRQDIQALRGLAVLLVVFFHARIGYVPAGFLGVDIFFVISGFLITSMIKVQIEKDQFSFKEFYFRRAKRLLPAAYVTFVVTSVVAIYLLTSIELSQYKSQLIGAVTFTANLVLMRQGSYFGGDAELKPLLHTWSLSVEEQYYILMPALLFLMPRRWWGRCIALFVMLSFGTCIAVGLWKPQVAFYIFPARAWELGLGSVGALVSSSGRAHKLAQRLFVPALVTIAVIPFIDIPGLHPGLDALLACCSTLVIILRAHPGASRRVFRPLAFVGDFSYSLYLVHWPLIAFAMNIWIQTPPIEVRVSVVLLALLLAWLQYRYIERPIHKAEVMFGVGRVSGALVASIFVAVLPQIAFARDALDRRYIEARRGNVGLGERCVSNGRFSLQLGCSAGVPPTILVWGDSYAMHMIPGLVQSQGGERIAQASQYVCGPLLGVAPIGRATGVTQNRVWAEGCLNYNKEVMLFLERTKSVHTVVLGSVFKQYLDHKVFGIFRGSGEVLEGPAEEAITMLAVLETIKQVRALGKRVIVIAPPPSLDWDAGMCAERMLRGFVLLGRYADCIVPENEYKSLRLPTLDLLHKIAVTGVPVIFLDDALREGSGFPATAEGEIVYIANGHLSYFGSDYVAKKMNLSDRIRSEAR